MKLKLINKSLVATTLTAITFLSSSALAGVGDWINQSGDFVTLDRSATKVEFFVVYPQLREGNCGIGITFNRYNNYSRNHTDFSEQITVTDMFTDNSGSDGLALSSVGNSGIFYSFDYDTQYYGTIVTITANDGQTFGDVFDSLSVYSPVHAIASAVSCQQLEEAK